MKPITINIYSRYSEKAKVELWPGNLITKLIAAVRCLRFTYVVTGEHVDAWLESDEHERR